MTSLSPTADIVTLVQASTVLPYMLFYLAAGAASDMADRCLLMLAAQLLAQVASVPLTVMIFFGGMTPLLLTFTFGRMRKRNLWPGLAIFHRRGGAAPQLFQFHGALVILQRWSSVSHAWSGPVRRVRTQRVELIFESSEWSSDKPSAVFAARQYRHEIRIAKDGRAGASRAPLCCCAHRLPPTLRSLPRRFADHAGHCRDVALPLPEAP